jgi:hypothetical protein
MLAFPMLVIDRESLKPFFERVPELFQQHHLNTIFPSFHNCLFSRSHHWDEKVIFAPALY